MDRRIRRDLMQSKKDFLGIVWPAVKHVHVLGGGKVIDVEGGPIDGLLRSIDIRGGVDYLQLPERYNGVRFLASRIQYGYSYNSFTIRYRKLNGQLTEYDKLYSNYAQHCIVPNVIIQAYIAGGKLVNAGIIPTINLLDFINMNRGALDIRMTSDRTEFVVVPWMRILGAGVYMDVVEGGK